MYDSYILFGSIEESIPQKVIDANSEIMSGISELNVLTINSYGFLDIAELKKHVNNKHISIDNARLKVRKALRDLNYVYAHIQIVL